MRQREKKSEIVNEAKGTLTAKELSELTALHALAQRLAQKADEAANVARICAFASRVRADEIIRAHGLDPAQHGIGSDGEIIETNTEDAQNDGSK